MFLGLAFSSLCTLTLQESLVLLPVSCLTSGDSYLYSHLTYSCLLGSLPYLFTVFDVILCLVITAFECI
jgi:TctA family transporter